MAERLPGTEPHYGGFWIRLVSNILDALIVSPLVILEIWLMSRNRLFYTLTSILGYGVHVYLFVFLVQRKGGSPGKLLSGLRVVKTDFNPVGWKEAWLREGVGLGIILLGSAVYLFALGRLSENEFLHLGLLERGRRIDELGGMAMKLSDWLAYGWYAGELIVLLTNRRRRALHDYIAGTVVIRVEKERAWLPVFSALLGMLAFYYAFKWVSRLP